MSKNKLRNKFLANFIAISIIPLIFMGFAALYLSNITRINDIQETSNLLLEQKKREIESFLDESLGLLNLKLANEIYDISVIPKDQLKFLVDGLMIENPFFKEVVVIDSSGKEIFKKILNEYVADYELLDRSGLDSFKKAIAKEEYISDVYYTTDSSFVSLSAPIYNNRDKVVGVLSAELDLSFINEKLKNAILGNSGYVFVLDGDGFLVSQSKDIYSFGDNLASVSEIANFIKGNISENNRYVNASLNKVFGFSESISNADLFIFSEWPEDDAMSIINTIIWQIVLISLVTFLGVLVLVFSLTQNIVKPIKVLKEGALKIGGGDLDHKINIKTKDEIEDLGNSFNMMAKDLKKLEELKEERIRSEALAEALQKEKEVSEMKSKFLANASHQLRTPTSVIGWTINLLFDKKELAQFPDVFESLKDLKKNSKSLALIISDLLAVSEFGFDYKVNYSDNVDIPMIIEKALDMQKDKIKEKNISVNVMRLDGYKKLRASIGAITKVIENLVDNAVTYTNKGGKINIAFGASEGGDFLFSISDTGIGIPEEDKKLIFSEFFRASNAVENKNVGTGLGLYVCKAAIEGHKGKIWFESERNKGTTFYFTIPFDGDNSKK